MLNSKQTINLMANNCDISAQIKELFTALEQLPSVRNVGFIRTQIYGKIRRLRMKIAKKKGSHTNNQWEILKKLHDYRCANCGKKEDIGCWLTKDHIRPISKGGDDSISNISPLCGKCNSRKGSSNGK